jgi:hypothetical protein
MSETTYFSRGRENSADLCSPLTNLDCTSTMAVQGVPRNPKTYEFKDISKPVVGCRWKFFGIDCQRRPSCDEHDRHFRQADQR